MTLRTLTDPTVRTRGRDDGAEPAGAALTDRSWILLALGIGLLAFLVRLVPILRGGGLTGIANYDDTVYFGAAVALVNGALPYRDFLLLHPPGTTVLLAPAALIGRLTTEATGLALGRLQWMAMGAVSAVLVTRILRPLGLGAAAVGGLVYALSYPAIYTEATTQLQGMQSLFVLLGLWAVATARRRTADRPVLAGRLVLTAGFALGVASTAKIWGVATVLLVALWLALGKPRRQALALLLGAAAGITVICLPFFLAAPAQMWRDVLGAQLGRPLDIKTARLTRVIDILGLRLAPTGWWPTAAAAAGLVTVAAVVMAVRNRTGRLATLVFVGQAVTLLVSPSWFRHYAAFSAPALALVIGSSVAGAGTLGRAGRTPRRWPAAAALLVAVVAVVVALPIFGTRFGRPFPTAAFAPVAAATKGCVTADSAIALIDMDVLGRDIARGCLTVVDLGGYSYAFHPHGPVILPRTHDPVWQRFASGYLRSGRASTIVVYRHQLSPASFASWHAGRLLARGHGLALRAGPG